MIFVALIVIGLLVFGFIELCGLALGAWLFFYSRKYEKREKQEKLKTGIAEPPSNVDILSRPTPFDWAKEMEGWDGAEELEINEDI